MMIFHTTESNAYHYQVNNVSRKYPSTCIEDVKDVDKRKAEKSLLVSIDMPVKRAAALTGINEKNYQQMDKEVRKKSCER